MKMCYFDYRFELDLEPEERRSIRRVLPHSLLGFPDTDVIGFSSLTPRLQERLRGELETCDLVPGWTMGDELFCWCEAHHRWNRHGSCGHDLALEFRVPHHRHEKTFAIVVQGEVQHGSELSRILKRYPHGLSQYTPPPNGLVRLILAVDTLPDEMLVRVLHPPEQLFYWVSPTAGVHK
jgi:hypothetical protein